MWCAVCDRVSAHLLVSPSDDRTDRRLNELLSQTVTLHWLAQVFTDHSVTGVDDYLRLLQRNGAGERQMQGSLTTVTVTV